MKEFYTVQDDFIIIEPYEVKDSLFHAILNATLIKYQNGLEDRSELCVSFKESLKDTAIRNNKEPIIMVEQLKNMFFNLNDMYNEDKNNNYNLIIENENVLDSKIIINNKEVKLFENYNMLNERSNIFFCLDNTLILYHLYFILSSYKVESGLGRPMMQFLENMETNNFDPFILQYISDIVHVNIVVLDNQNYIIFNNTENFKSDSPFIILEYSNVYKTVGNLNNLGLSEQLFNSKHKVVEYLKTLEMKDIKDQPLKLKDIDYNTLEESDVEEEIIMEDVDEEFISSIDEEDEEQEEEQEEQEDDSIEYDIQVVNRNDELESDYIKEDVSNSENKLPKIKPEEKSEESEIRRQVKELPEAFKNMTIRDLKKNFPGEKITLANKYKFIRLLYKRLIK